MWGVLLNVFLSVIKWLAPRKLKPGAPDTLKECEACTFDFASFHCGFCPYRTERGHYI